MLSWDWRWRDPGNAFRALNTSCTSFGCSTKWTLRSVPFLILSGGDPLESYPLLNLSAYPLGAMTSWPKWLTLGDSHDFLVAIWCWTCPKQPYLDWNGVIGFHKTRWRLGQVLEEYHCLSGISLLIVVMLPSFTIIIRCRSWATSQIPGFTRRCDIVRECLWRRTTEFYLVQRLTPVLESSSSRATDMPSAWDACVFHVFIHELIRHLPWCIHLNWDIGFQY